MTTHSAELIVDSSKIISNISHLKSLISSESKFMFIVTVTDIKPGGELTANYNLYTYPKTGVGIQMI